jgi:chaperonin GroES
MIFHNNLWGAYLMTKRKTSSTKELIIVGDRVLIDPDVMRERTNHGLYLPQGIEEKEKIQSGYVVKTGPGYLLPDPNSISEEPWHKTQQEARYLPLQTEEGDYVIFLRKSAIELEYESRKYLIVPQSAILLIIRENILDELSPDKFNQNDEKGV